MGTEPTSRAILVGRLMVIAPAIAAIPLVVFLGLRTFGPFLILYYVVAGIALGCQWYSIAVPRWREWLAKKEVHDSEVAHLELVWFRREESEQSASLLFIRRPSRCALFFLLRGLAAGSLGC